MATAVLTSGGLDSSVLVAELSRQSTVYPLYVRAGLGWEDDELSALRAYLAALDSRLIAPLTVLGLPVRDIYGEHWSTQGKGAPPAGSPEERLFLPGRNILLLGLAATWASVRGIQRVAIGTLSANRFPDAQAAFFDRYGRVLSQGLGTPVEVLAPYLGMTKAQLIRRHPDLPLELTLTCAAPRQGRHCGVCMKCEERRAAFAEAGVPDRTSYVDRPSD